MKREARHLNGDVVHVSRFYLNNGRAFSSSLSGFSLELEHWIMLNGSSGKNRRGQPLREVNNLITIQKLSRCTWEDTLTLWNQGFAGYSVNVTLTMENFLSRMGQYGLMPDHSFVALKDGKLVGFVLNGIRTIKGTKMAWNGGTGIIPECRRQGIGKMLMEATLKTYKEEKVEVALLEAIATNQAAISLYERAGYQIMDRLGIFSAKKELAREEKSISGFTIHRGLPSLAAQVPFYRIDSPWQTHWFSIATGEAIIARGQAGETAGYSLVGYRLDEHGVIKGIHLYQLEVNPECTDPEKVIRLLLFASFAKASASIPCVAFNLPLSKEQVVATLLELGFHKEGEQVHMKYNLCKEHKQGNIVEEMK
jgi:ribosomal protein S18 acetylase RimI-like enzyme